MTMIFIDKLPASTSRADICQLLAHYIPPHQQSHAYRLLEAGSGLKIVVDAAVDFAQATVIVRRLNECRWHGAQLQASYSLFCHH